MGRSLSTPESGRLDPSPVHIGRAGQDSGYEPPSPVCPRPFDVSSQGYNNWVFMSTHFWDEDPRGLWILGLENKGYYFNTGTLYRYTLLLYGTAEDMTARPSGPQSATAPPTSWATFALPTAHQGTSTTPSRQ